MEALGSSSSSTDREVLMVGSSRVRGLQWRRYPGYSLKLVSIPGLRHEDLIKEVDARITNQTSILILVCLQVELHARTKSRSGQAGMIYANPTPPIDSIVSRLSCADYRWKTSHGLHVIWVAPYTPNLLLLNEVRKRARKWGTHLTDYEKEMAEHFMEVIDGNRKKLIMTMRQHSLQVTELPLSKTHLTRQCNSDGLHLGNIEKKELFGAVIENAMVQHKSGPPNVQPIEMPLNPELREAVNQVRRQKRKMQRTRAAERELYRAAEEEKNADANAPKAKKPKLD